MTNEERAQIAIDSMKYFKQTLYNGIYGEFVGNFDTAISALEKQILKKPNIYNRFERHCECGAIVKTYQNYCSNCGQALDWSDSDDS